MVDDLDEKSSETFDLEHYLGLVRRRHLHFLIPLFLAWLMVWGSSWVLPPRYRSGTLILVEQPTMPKDYVTPNVNDDLQERLQSITQQILSRTRLLRIIDQFHLYTERAHVTPDEKVDKMRKEIEIDLVRGAREQITAFNIYYSARDPRLAQQVTSELSNLFINENIEVRQQQSEDTTKFLESQMETARASLNEQEEKIRQFKGQHVGELPAQLETNLQILSGMQSQLRTEEDALNTAKQQRVYLQTLVDQYRSLQPAAKGSDGAPVGLPALDQELDRLKARLADLTSHYTERHPDVRKLKEQIAETERMRSKLFADLKAHPAGAQSDNTDPTASVDPVQASALLQLQGQLQANQVEIANRERSIAATKVKVEEYQARLNQEPVREQQLADLTRGYEQSKVNYDSLLKKKNESAMATSMELLQQGERFRVLDPPGFPQKPDFPNRLKFCAIGLGVGIILGIVIAGAFEMMDDRVHNESELKNLLPAEVIADIPAILGPADEARGRRTALVGWATAAVVFVTILAGTAFSYLRG